MDDNNGDVIELKLDGQQIRLNAYVCSVLREINLGLLRTLDLPKESPNMLDLTLKVKL